MALRAIITIIIYYCDYELASSPCTHLPGEDECMHACMLPELLHVQEFELPIISRADCACRPSQDSRRRRSCMYQGGTQDQDVKDVDRWMKIKRQVILVLLCALLPMSIYSLIIPFVYNVNLHIVSSPSQKTLLTTYLSIYPLSTSSHFYFNKR